MPSHDVHTQHEWTVAAIRAHFPNPIRLPETEAEDDTLPDGAYCVGGALCYALLPGNDASFPDPGLVAEALRQLNPALLYEDAVAFAHRIIEVNDRGDFAQAWDYAEQACRTEG